MSVHRLRHYSTEDPFTRVPNVAVTDPRLDLKARGLLLVMLSKPDGWTFRERNLADASGVGRDQVRSAMKTLMDAGYVVRRRESEPGKPPILVTEVYDSPKVGFSDRRDSQPRETRPLSNEGRSNKANQEVGAAAPVQRDTDTDSEPGRHLPVETAASGKNGKASERAITDSSYAARLLDELGDAAPDLDEERLADNYLALFEAAKKAGRPVDAVAMGLTLALLVRTFGPLPGQARGMLARMVKANGPTAVMHAAVTTAGSTIGADPKYADDPLGPVRYLSGVVRGRK